MSNTAESATLFETLVEMVTPIVANIEASTPTTMGRYDKYMAALSRIAGMIDPTGKQDQEKVYRLLGLVLVRAGANKRGVESALMVMGYR